MIEKFLAMIDSSKLESEWPDKNCKSKKRFQFLGVTKVHLG